MSKNGGMNMDKKLKRMFAVYLAVCLTICSVFSSGEWESSAAKKKVKLEKKLVNVYVGNTVKIKLKNNKKKTKWTVISGKKNVSLSKKKKNSVMVKAKKTGKAKVQAKVGRKKYIATVMVFQKKQEKQQTKAPTVTPQITPNNTQQVMPTKEVPQTTLPTQRPTETPTVEPTATPTQTPTSKPTVEPTATPTATATPTVEPTATPTVEPTAAPTVEPTATPTATPVNSIYVDDRKVDIDESKTYPITISELNETTFTSAYKRSDGEQITKKTRFFADGSVAFTSSRDYNSGVSFYINPVTNEDQIIDVSDTRGEGFSGYDNGTKDVSEYDYIRIVVTSQNELNFRTYNGNEELRTADFPGRPTSETYEGAWIHTPTDSIWEDASPFSAGNKAKAEYETRVVYIPMQTLMWKGANPETLTAIAICPQASDVEVTIHNIDFVKVKCDKLVTGIDVESYKTELEAGKSRTLSAVVTPADASRQIVKWTSDNEDIATVNFQGVVTAKKGVEGTVTITAEATDGSGVTGSIQMKVRDPDKVIEVKTHKFGLASDNITAKTTSVSSGGTVVEAGKSALGIEFIPGEALNFVDFSAYLENNNINMASYDALEVTWEVRDKEGNVITDYANAEGTPIYGKIAYAPIGELNGYSQGIDINWEGEDDTMINNFWLSSPFTGQTCELVIAKTNPADIITVAGFNLQLSSLPANMHLVVKDITLEKN